MVVLSIPQQVKSGVIVKLSNLAYYLSALDPMTNITKGADSTLSHPNLFLCLALLVHTHVNRIHCHFRNYSNPATHSKIRRL